MVQAPTQLPKRALGKTGVQVSCVGMGCSPFGHAYGVSPADLFAMATTLYTIYKYSQRKVDFMLQSPDEAAAMKAVDAAFKSGVNFFDVAPFYASGDAERVSYDKSAAMTSSLPCMDRPQCCRCLSASPTKFNVIAVVGTCYQALASGPDHSCNKGRQVHSRRASRLQCCSCDQKCTRVFGKNAA